MWMVGGYNMNETSHHQHHHHHHQVNLEGFNGGRKLRPLIPRPPAVASASSAATHSCNFGLYTGSHIFAGTVGGEQGFSHKSVNNINNNKEEVNNNNNNNNNGGGGQQGVMSSSSSSRWNPTVEQLRTLEDLYRRGTRTPSTDQIQRITAQLRRYGKIEGKNVFYWFQNHKARERQKRRRELQLLSSSSSNHPQSHHDDDDEPIIPRKERGPASAKQCYETEQTRSYYASAAAEECGVMSMQRAIAAEKAGRRAEAVSVHRSSSSRHNNNINNNNNNNSGACLFQPDKERNATWHNLAPSSSSPSFCYSPSSLIARVIATTSSTPPTTADACATPKTRRFIGSLKESNPSTTNGGELYIYEDDDEGGDSATLQLFPLRSRVDGQQQQQHDQDKSKERDVHFFEFLPPKID